VLAACAQLETNQASSPRYRLQIPDGRERTSKLGGSIYNIGHAQWESNQASTLAIAYKYLGGTTNELETSITVVSRYIQLHD